MLLVRLYVFRDSLIILLTLDESGLQLRDFFLALMLSFLYLFKFFFENVDCVLSENLVQPHPQTPSVYHFS